MTIYAKATTCSPETSKRDIEKTLLKYGVKEKMFADLQDRAMIEFLHKERRVRFTLPLPLQGDPQFAKDQAKRSRTLNQRKAAWEQCHRQRWRAMYLAIKGKLEMVESGICSFEQEFAAQIVLPDNRTVADHVLPVIKQCYETKQVLPMLSYGGPPAPAPEK